MALKTKIFISFFIVIILTSFFSTFVGVKLIGESIVPRIQDHARLDLNSARELYQEAVVEVQNIIRFTAVRYFISDALTVNMPHTLIKRLDDIRRAESLDFLSITDPDGHVIARSGAAADGEESVADNPLIAKVISERQVVSSTEIFTQEELKKENAGLAERAVIPITPTPHSVEKNRTVETSGLVIVSAAPIAGENGELLGILYGGRLLNRNYAVVDLIRDTVYERETYRGKDAGVATIFLGDIRVSTNIETEEGERAIGTIVSRDVDTYVLGEGNTWIERAFVVDDWYITAYEPIRNIHGENIGILGMGLLERKYRDMQTKALWMFLGISMGGILISMVICYILTNTIMRPVDSLLHVSREITDGHLDRHVSLEKAPKEIEALGKAFNTMVDSIRDRDEKLRLRAQEEIMKSERLAMIGQLAAGVAHEINNPLGGILLFSRLLLKKAPDEGVVRENLERIEKDAKRCQTIVQGLLDFAREREPKMIDVRPNDIAEISINLFENQAMFHNIDVVKNYGDGLPTVFADPSQIEQVLVNIIMNAADAMKGEGALTIATRISGDGRNVEFSFADTGGGIPEDKLERVFEPFFTTKGVGHGTGLGLSISYGIVRRHGGAITVSSVVGKGSIFTVSIPVSREGEAVT